MCHDGYLTRNSCGARCRYRNSWRIYFSLCPRGMFRSPSYFSIDSQLVLKRILLILAWLITLGNLATSLSMNHSMMLAMRFLAGLPHGAFFGTGSIVAERLSTRGKEGQTVAVMLMGISGANVVGVPIAAILAHMFSWQAAFLLTATWGATTLLLIWLFIPHLPPLHQEKTKGQFSFLKKPAVWILLSVTLLANNGYFCFYSYIKPYLTQVAGFSVPTVSALLLLAGIAMCMGNGICGKCSDCFTPARCAMTSLIFLFIGLSCAFLFGHIRIVAALATFLVSGCIFGAGLCWQVLILHHARGCEMIGVACIQIAFNSGNAIGAWCGAIPLSLGYPSQYTAVPGVVFAALAIILLSIFIWRYETQKPK